MQSSMDHMPQMAGMQRNFLREFQSADAPMYGMQEAEPFQPTTPFPEQTPPSLSEPFFRHWTIPIGEVVPVHEKQKLLSMIRKYDFVLYELQLYLDTHPRCPEALRMWKNYQAMRQKAATAYVRQYGPLQPLQTSGDSPWAWNQGPWPWEKEAN